MTETPEEVVARAVARARASQAAWAALGVAERVRRLAPLKDRLLDGAAAMAACIHEEVGKPVVEALLGEVLPSADVVVYWTRSIEALLEPMEVPLDPLSYPSKQGTLSREPRGVVGVIMPWNFPVALPLRTIVPALLAGNAVVFKPSEVAPRSGALLAEALSGLVPEGVFACVQGARDVGAALVGADVDFIVFTGGTAAGRSVARACAERLVPCALELGGKDAAIVLDDADLERAAHGVVWGSMMNAGQNCASIERVYVDRRVADAFQEKVSAAVRSLRFGVDVERLATRAQRERVAAQVAAATAAGAIVLAGGEGAGEGPSATADPRAYPPTVVRAEGEAAGPMREETFGPVLALAVVDGEDEAIDRANASRYGLTASLWTRNAGRGRRLAGRLRAGVVTINNHGFTGALPGAPWTGRGDSGWGVTGSPLALDALTMPRFVLVDRSRARRELWWFPYTPALAAVASSMAVVRSSTQSLWSRGRALVALILAMMRRSREL
ncbi:MAG TPA: aldehyde dehydrogenase family protein [Polyangiaceae bacterium]|jgi:acyl-CoA reductase-like NAD-dependent aldehyde dehydrogenase